MQTLELMCTHILNITRKLIYCRTITFFNCIQYVLNRYSTILENVLILVVLMSIDGVFKLSAYADDITLFISNYTDIFALQDIINLYESVSNSRVNWNKACGSAKGGFNGCITAC